MESQIIRAAIASRSAYEAIKDHVEPKEVFSPIGQFWWTAIERWYRADARATRIDTVVLLEQTAAEIDRAKSPETLRGVLTSDDMGDISAPNIVRAVLDARKRSMLLELAGMDLSQHAARADKLFDRLTSVWERSRDGSDDGVAAKHSSELLEVLSPGARIKLLPYALNERIAGGCLPGQHIVVFGRTEVGKSSFMCNLCAGFLAAQLRVLYFGNEDSIDALKFRFVCRVAKVTADHARRHYPEIRRSFDSRRGDELVQFRHFDPGGIGSVERAIRDHGAQVAIIDQFRNLAGAEPDLTRRMEINAQRIRGTFAKTRCLGISVTQARDASIGHNARPPIWLQTGDVADSRVGLPATADLMLGLGADQEMIQKGQRALSFAKNKLDAGPLSRAGLILHFDLMTGVVTA